MHCTDLQTKTSHFWPSNKGLFLDIVFKNMIFIFGILRHAIFTYKSINMQCVCLLSVKGEGTVLLKLGLKVLELSYYLFMTRRGDFKLGFDCTYGLQYPP